MVNTQGHNSIKIKQGKYLTLLTTAFQCQQIKISSNANGKRPKAEAYHGTLKVLAKTPALVIILMSTQYMDTNSYSKFNNELFRGIYLIGNTSIKDKWKRFMQHLQNAGPNQVIFRILKLYEFSLAFPPKVHLIRHHLPLTFHHWPGEHHKKKHHI